MSELIQPEINRTFSAGLGDWAGDYSWGEEEYLELFAYMQLIRPPPNLPYYTQLLYPAFDSPPNKDLILTFLMGACFHNNNLVSYSIKLLDGVNTLSPTSWADVHTDTWAHHTLTFTTPALWNKRNAKILIQIQNGPWWTTTLRFKNFSLTKATVARVDHLPLLGVH